MKHAHKLRRNKAVQSPRNFFFVDTETYERKTERFNEHHLKLGCGNYTQIRDSKGKESTDWLDFTDNNVFWVWVDNHIRNKQKYYLYAHNQHFDFFVLDGFKQLTDLGWQVKTWFINSGVFIISFMKDKKKLLVLDSGNIRKCSLAQIGEIYGLQKLDVDFATVSDEELRIYCRRDVEIVKRWILSFREFLLKHQLGNYRPTLASQAMGAYRHRFMKHDIFIHDNERAYALERLSYHGGRTECFLLGEYSGEPFYFVDVNSMYPYVMQKDNYPIKLIMHRKTITQQQLSTLLYRYAIISDVLIETKENIFVHQEDKTVFPVGTFRTVLTTNELRYALNNDMIKKVYETTAYKKAPIFYKYVHYFYKLKSQHKKEGNQPYAEIDKGFLNLLYGKFGQFSQDNTTIELCDKDDFSSEICIDADTDEIYTLFSFGGKVFKQCGKKESFDSFPAIASHVTANARLYLYDLMRLTGLENLYYCDTDSLLINQRGYDNIKSILHDTKLGSLSLQATADYIYIKGAKDYIFGDKVKIKGISKKAVEIEPNRYQQTQFLKFRSMIKQNHQGSALTREMKKRLSRSYDKGRLDRNGVVHPFVLS